MMLLIALIINLIFKINNKYKTLKITLNKKYVEYNKLKNKNMLILLQHYTILLNIYMNLYMIIQINLFTNQIVYGNKCI